MLKYEPMDLKLVMEDPSVVEAFKKYGCMIFCHKLQGDLLSFLDCLSSRLQEYFLGKSR